MYWLCSFFFVLSSRILIHFVAPHCDVSSSRRDKHIHLPTNCSCIPRGELRRATHLCMHMVLFNSLQRGGKLIFQSDIVNTLGKARSLIQKRVLQSADRIHQAKQDEKRETCERKSIYKILIGLLVHPENKFRIEWNVREWLG